MNRNSRARTYQGHTLLDNWLPARNVRRFCNGIGTARFERRKPRRTPVTGVFRSTSGRLPGAV